MVYNISENYGVIFIQIFADEEQKKKVVGMALVKGWCFGLKEKKILDTTTNDRDELIEEARVSKFRKKVPLWQRWTAIVVVLATVAIIAALVLLTSRDKDLNTGENIIQVVYPKAYAYTDPNGWIEVREQNPVDDDFIKAVNEFSYKTSANILTEAGKNINYSPISLYFAMSLAASGAEGETEEQLLALLGVSDKEVLSKQCGNLYRTLHKDNEIGKLKIANSLWMDDEFKGKPIIFKDDFVRQAAENFYASSHSVDFANDETGRIMADWISKNTNGTLSPKLEINPEQILSILNAVYFYDQWTDRFDRDKTAEDVFYLSNGSEVKADFMNQTYGSARFTKGEGFTTSSLNLKNNGCEMVFILPDEGISPYNLILSPEEMKQTFEGGESIFGEVVWKIPKFSFGLKLSFTKMLNSLGVSSAFRPDADFSGITDHMCYITDIEQETHIGIDEEGVEASAYTQFNYQGAALPEGRADMILDRPFIYGITTQNGTLIFVGVCENPTEN